MENLINRLRQMGVMLLIGFLLIIYIAIGLVYWQQTSRQRELTEQVANLNATLSRALPSAEKLQAEYRAVNLSLTPMTAKSALDIIVGIADNSGINTAPEAGKFSIPSALISKVKIGVSSYQVLSFKNIKARGNYDKVMAFISDLDSGATRQTIVLKRVDIQEEAIIKGEEEVIIEGEEEVIIETIATLEVDIYTKPE